MPQPSDDVVGVPKCEPAPFGWSAQSVEDVIVIWLAGELDLSTAELRPLLLQAVECGTAATIVLDMSNVRFIDAHSIGVIVGAWTAAKARGRVLQVDGLRGLPARVFHLLGLEPMLVRPPAASTDRGNMRGRG